jgi:hypothetical protein
VGTESFWDIGLAASDEAADDRQKDRCPEESSYRL